MTKFEQSFLVQAASEPPLPRPEHGHRQAESGPADGDQADADPSPDVEDPHPNWLKTWRSLRVESGGRRQPNPSGGQIRELQDKIAHTPAGTLAGLQAQAELISELAWNDVVASTSRQLIAGIRRLRKSGAGS